MSDTTSTAPLRQAPGFFRFKLGDFTAVGLRFVLVFILVLVVVAAVVASPFSASLCR